MPDTLLSPGSQAPGSPSSSGRRGNPLRPEVEIPRPRGSGAAVVAVAALAMFTAVGASAFVVRARMNAGAFGPRAMDSLPSRVASERTRSSELRDAFLTAAAQLDDRTALEIYRSLPPGGDPAGHLAAVRDNIVTRQLAILEVELTSGDCYALRTHVDWLRRVAPEEGIDVRAVECPRRDVVEVELVGPDSRPRR